MKAKAVSIVGFKDSGKTRVVEALVNELAVRGYKVATIKHTVEDVALDTPGKDTWRHRKAGATASAILHDNGLAVFLENALTPYEIAPTLGGHDYLILEGFKHLNTVPRILVPKTLGDIEELSNSLEIAIVNSDSVDVTHESIPVIKLGNPGELADIVEEKAFSLLPGLNCRGCGYDGCSGLAQAILQGEAGVQDCVVQMSGLGLKVNGKVVALNKFTRDVIRNVVKGVLETLKGMDDPKIVELVMEYE